MHYQSIELRTVWQASLLVLVAAALVLLPDMALAGAGAGDTPMGNVLCTVKNWFTGNTGKGLATIAVTVIGIGALLGKVSWGMAIIVGIGVSLIFGAVTLVDVMGAGIINATTTCYTS